MESHLGASMSTARSANRNCSAKIDVDFLNKLRGAFSVSTRTAVAVNDCRGILYVSPRRSVRGGIESRGFDAAERERQLRGGDVARLALVGALGSYCTFQAARPVKESMPHALAGFPAPELHTSPFLFSETLSCKNLSPSVLLALISLRNVSPLSASFLVHLGWPRRHPFGHPSQ
jgi:hypothetical protein